MKKQNEYGYITINQYGAKELQNYQKKAIIKGFSITLLIFLVIGFVLPDLFSIKKLNLDETIFNPSPTEIERYYTEDNTIIKNSGESNLNSKTTLQAGSGMKAGNPIPIAVENENSNKIEFADVKLAGVSFADGREGDNVIINSSPSPTTIVTMNEPSIKETHPDSEEFIVYEKEAFVNLNDLKRIIVYPQIAKAASIQGNVTIQVLISADGLPIKAKILSSDNAVLDQAAIDAVMKIKYQAAIQNGINVSSWLIIPINFQLKN